MSVWTVWNSAPIFVNPAPKNRQKDNDLKPVVDETISM